MSEYQVVKFRAIDRPLTVPQLAFMNRQSSRADYTKWEFEVEYHYSGFRGDINGMLRNGYDLFLKFANYGEREIRMRLPNGLPFPKSVWSKYVDTECMEWTADKSGKAGILAIAPFLEDVDPQEDELDDYLDAAAKMRERLMAGDLRALYVLWLISTSIWCDDEEEIMEPPVPHGLDSFPTEAANLLCYFEVDPLLVEAAAMGIPSFNAHPSQDESVTSWLDSISDSRRTEIVKRLVSEDPVSLKAELLSEMRDRQPAVTWPVEKPSRTVSELMERYSLLRQQADEKRRQQAEAKAKREAAQAEEKRQARMAEMRLAPDPWLKQASKLVEGRGSENYRAAADLLADLRDAFGGSDGSKIALKHAAHLAKRHSTLHLLKGALRKRGLLE